MRQHEVYFNKAREVASQSHFRIRMGAVVVRQRRVIGAGNNVLKSHPMMHKPGNFFRCIHAEIAACLNAPRDGLSGSVVYVARLLKNGKPALAKPCEACDELLARFRVKRAYYTVGERESYLVYGEVRYGQGLSRYV